MTKEEQKEIEDYINRKFKSLYPSYPDAEIKKHEWEIVQFELDGMFSTLALMEM